METGADAEAKEELAQPHRNPDRQPRETPPTRAESSPPQSLIEKMPCRLAFLLDDSISHKIDIKPARTLMSPVKSTGARTARWISLQDLL